MKTFKYFSLSDSKQESMGRILANDLQEAFIKAALIKKLDVIHFKKLFSIEEIDE